MRILNFPQHLSCRHSSRLTSLLCSSTPVSSSGQRRSGKRPGRWAGQVTAQVPSGLHLLRALSPNGCFDDLYLRFEQRRWSGDAARGDRHLTRVRTQGARWWQWGVRIRWGGWRRTNVRRCAPINAKSQDLFKSLFLSLSDADLERRILACDDMTMFKSFSKLVDSGGILLCCADIWVCFHMLSTQVGSGPSWSGSSRKIMILITHRPLHLSSILRLCCHRNKPSQNLQSHAT